MDSEFKILESILRATSLRQRVIASNIANTDTPGYRAKDVDFKSLVAREGVKLLTTDPRHLKGTEGKAGAKVIVEDTPSWGDGNNVELNIEMAKMIENALVHDTAITVMSTKIRMFKNALSRR
jgi:flagellar basal-body rod protein FlgB